MKPHVLGVWSSSAWVAASITLCLLRGYLAQGACTCSTAGAVTTISCPGFDGDTSLLQLNGATNKLQRTPTNDYALRLAGTSDGCVSGSCCSEPADAHFQTGSAWSQQKIALGPGGSFTTKFQFQITCPGVHDYGKADGFTFALNTLSNTAGGNGNGLGFSGIDNSLAVEFDTFPNGGDCNNDPNDNHMGIDVNGNVLGCNIPIPTGSIAVTAIPDFNLASGNVITAWVDYDGTSLSAYAAPGASNSKPTAPILTYKIDIAATLGATEAYAGFTASTGGGQENHDILTWDFKSIFDNQGPHITTLNVPTTLTSGSPNLTLSGTASDASFGDSDVTTVTYSLDNGAPVTVSGLTPAVAVPFQTTLTGLDQLPLGSAHTLCFQATDVFGNAGPATCQSFTVAVPPGFCVASTGAPGVCAQNCGKGASGCNCFDLQVVAGRCVPCADGIVGTPPNANCVAPDGQKAGSNRAAPGATYCNVANPRQPCAVDTSCKNGGGSTCGSGGKKCCHF